MTLASVMTQTPTREAAAQGGNDLLARLEAADLRVLERRLVDVELAAGAVLYEPGAPVEACYFPTGAAMASFFVELAEGVAVETVLVGREGALGGVVSHGHLPAFARANVLNGGVFRRIALADLEAAKREAPAIDRLLVRYADCLMAQVFQSIACNAVHTIEQRAAKWLLAAARRLGHSRLTMTQEQLAGMMGVGRSYASRVLQRFKKDALLRTRRGGLELLEPARLEARACSCDAQVQSHFEAVLGKG